MTKAATSPGYSDPDIGSNDQDHRVTHTPTTMPPSSVQDTEDESSTLDAIPGGHWLAENPLRSAFLVITVLALAVRFSVLKDSSFITDDFMLSARAMESPLSWDYLTRVHTGHFEPIGFATMWLLAHFAPLSWGWTCVTLLAGQALLSVMVWKLLVELFDRKPLILVPYAVFSFTPLTLPAFTWLSAAIIWLPLMIAIAGAMRWHARFVRTGRTRDAVLAALWFTVGLASFEKIVVYLPFIVAFTVALRPDVPVRVGALARLALQTWKVWLGYLVASIAYLVLYIPGVQSIGNESPVTAPKAGPLSDFVFLSVFRTLIPGAFGGPWRWQPSSYALAIVDSPRAFDWACWILALAVVVGSLVLRRRVGRFWFALFVYLAGSIATIAAGRVAYGGAIVALETRYLADAAVPLVATFGACLLPLRGERSPWTPQQRRLLTVVPTQARYLGLASALALMVALSFHAMGGYAQYSTNNPSRAFVSNTKDSLARLPKDAQIYETAVPGQIIGPLFANYNLVSRYVSPLVSDAQRDQLYTRRAFTKPYVLNGAGSLVPMRVELASSSLPTPGSCRPVEGGEVDIPLQGALFEWGWAVRIGYLSDADATATVHLGDAEQDIQVTKGLSEVYVSLVGAGDSVRITGVPSGVNFCVGDVQVGQATPSS